MNLRPADSSAAIKIFVTNWHVHLKSKCVFGIHKQKHIIPNMIEISYVGCFFLFSKEIQTHKIFFSLFFFFKKKQTSHLSFSHISLTVQLISVRNHTVHFISQLFLKSRNRLSGSTHYQVSSCALHFIQAHAASFSNLPLSKVHKLRVPCIDTETLRDQDLWLVTERV